MVINDIFIKFRTNFSRYRAYHYYKFVLLYFAYNYISMSFEYCCFPFFQSNLRR